MVFFVDKLSAEVVRRVLDFVDVGQRGGTIVPRTTELGRIVKLASRRALPSPSPSANLVGFKGRAITPRLVRSCA